MHIELLVFFRRFELKKIFKSTSYGERERRRLLNTESSMTQRTQRELPIARQLRRINDRRFTIRSVFFAWSMTPLTRDAERVSRPTIMIRHAHICNDFEERRVTLETTRHDWPAKLQRSIAIPGTVYPTPDFRPIRHGQLKKSIVFSPVQISLAFAT